MSRGQSGASLRLNRDTGTAERIARAVRDVRWAPGTGCRKDSSIGIAVMVRLPSVTARGIARPADQAGGAKAARQVGGESSQGDFLSQAG